MKAYKHIFFDLDHTLWDFERSCNETLDELYGHYDFQRFPDASLAAFRKAFHEVNYELWSLYDQNKIDKDEIRSSRFNRVFQKLHWPSEDCPPDLDSAYLLQCPQKPYLIYYSMELLNHLKASGKYRLHILTNGFKDVQGIKMRSSNIEGYFDKVITSECTGFKKPSKEIFDHALTVSGAELAHSVMIGDNLNTDVKGALGIGMDCVFFNPQKLTHQEKVSVEIRCLSELKDLF